MTHALLLALLACGSQTAADLEQPAPPPEPHVLTRASNAAALPVQGTIRLVTVKNGETEVPGRFEKISGELKFADVDSWQGISGDVKIDLSSWVSDEELRDQRVRNTFFEVGQFGTAILSPGSITGVPSGGLRPNESARASLGAKLTLHGVTRDVTLPVEIYRTAKEGFEVKTAEPYELKISDYQMGDQLSALIKECAHKSVDDVVKVTAELTLGKLVEVPADRLKGAKAGDAGEGAPDGGAMPGAAGDKAAGDKAAGEGGDAPK
jgi:polyisoprenoid-binding protein YceI